MSEKRYALFHKGQNIFKSGRSYKSKSYAQEQLHKWNTLGQMCNTQMNIEIREIEVQTESESKDAQIKLLEEALVFYDGVHRQNWAIDLNELSVVAKTALDQLKKMRGE